MSNCHDILHALYITYKAEMRMCSKCTLHKHQHVDHIIASCPVIHTIVSNIIQWHSGHVEITRFEFGSKLKVLLSEPSGSYQDMSVLSEEKSRVVRENLPSTTRYRNGSGNLTNTVSTEIRTHSYPLRYPIGRRSQREMVWT